MKPSVIMAPWAFIIVIIIIYESYKNEFIMSLKSSKFIAHIQKNKNLQAVKTLEEQAISLKKTK